MQRTRRELLSLLKRRGRATLEELAEDVGLAQITVRAHLNHLKEEGLIQATEEHGRIGRPFFVYSLTPSAEDMFPKQYDRLAGSILDSVMSICGRERMGRLCKNVGDLLALRYAERMPAHTTIEDRVRALADVLNEDGALVEWQHDPESGTILIHKYNCPYSCMSHKHPELCTIDLHVMRRLFDPCELQTNLKVEHIECARCDEGRCGYRITVHPATNHSAQHNGSSHNPVE